jgi:hypothetical protein
MKKLHPPKVGYSVENSYEFVEKIKMNNDDDYVLVSFDVVVVVVARLN